MSLPRPSITVLFPDEGEAWSAFAKRISATKGEVIIILTNREADLLAHRDQCKRFFEEIRPLRARLRVAVKASAIAAVARESGHRVIARARELRELLAGHGKLDEALRVFSPHRWRQQLKSRLQDLGLLSLPKLRIFVLVCFSIILFSFVIFRLLPSADIRVWARSDSINQTANIYLVQSGAKVELPSHIETMPLIPISVTVSKSLTYDHIRRESIGSASTLPMTIINQTDTIAGLKKGTRFVNQAGMVFRIQKLVLIPPHGEVTARAIADDLDLYEQIIGERGNVPAGLRWDLPGLSVDEQKKIFGENRGPGEGGSTSYRQVLKSDDIAAAKTRLEQELEAAAKEEIEKQRVLLNSRDTTKTIQLILLPELIRKEFVDIHQPDDKLGQALQSFTIDGSLKFTVLGYDAKAILDVLSEKLRTHVREGKQMLAQSLTLDRLDVRVIYYNDDLAWVKLTVDLTGSEQYILDPLSPTGALFGRKVRESVVGLSKKDALRIVKNLPEVESVDISLWPPFNQTLPSIPSHITIAPQ